MTAAERMDTDRPDPPALAEALRLLGMGLWPIPITPPDDPRSQSPGKAPIGAGWGKVRHTEETLRAVFRQHPGAGVGLKLGKDAGVIDIEIDDRERGEATLVEMFDGQVFESMGWESRRGSHRLAAWDDRLAAYGRSIVKWDGVEIRIGSAGPGGPQLQSVVPPTLGREWNGIETIAPLPDCFFAYLDRLFIQPSPGDRPSATIPIYTPPPGSRSPEDRARAFLRKTPPAVSGERGHDQAFKTVCAVGPGFDLPRDVATQLIREWSATCQPPWSEKEVAHKVSDAYRKETRRGWLLPENKSSGVTPLTPLTPKGVDAGPSGPTYGVNGVNGVTPDEENEPPIVVRTWPDPPRPAAFTGLVGEFVDALDEHTEADRVAVLIQFLVAFGNMIGRRAGFVVEADVHHLNLFACIVGLSSKGRKGTSWGTVRWLLSVCDAGWEKEHVLGGLVSGEGMIWAVRDQIDKDEPIKQKGIVTGYQKVMVDAGVADKRALFLETEMGRVLKVMGREGNTLSDLIRQAWETGNLRTATKNNPAKATGAHISIIGHITTGEAAKYLSETEAGNGFGNRFLWACVKRSKLLPKGARFRREAFQPFIDRLQRLTDSIKRKADAEPDGFLVLHREPGAEVFWESIYTELSEGKPGLLGSIVGRAEAQVMRLACLYALLDGWTVIRLEHVDAALALWDYCEASARFTFGDALGDRDADHLLSALRSHPLGLTRSQIRSDVFGRNKSADEIARVLGRLLEFKRVRSEVVSTGGRPATHWFAADTPKPATPEFPPAVVWLRDWLERGTGRPESTRQQARAAGFSDEEVEAAFGTLGVVTRRRPDGEWCGLPDAAYWGYHDDWED